MAKTVHFVKGCPWADGHIQQSDTFQTTNWYAVTCKHCRNNSSNRPVPVEINEIIFHVAENFEMFDKKFNKKLWRDYIDMIAYGTPLQPKSYYKKLKDG